MKEPKNKYDLMIQDDNPQRMKLIDYFNQHWEEELGERGPFNYKNRLDSVHLISYQDGFMEWLVENKKIDFGKLRDIEEQSGWDCCKLDYKNSGKNKENLERLIMILSIQDNPETALLYILL